MKKYLSVLGVAAMAACATSAFAQGTVNFNNGTGLVKQWTDAGNSTLIPVPKGGGFVQMFWATTGTAYSPWNASLSASGWYALNPGWALAGNPQGFTTPGAGKFVGGTLTLAPLTPPGGNIDYVVVGWTGAAASFDAALTSGTAMVGVSDKATSATGNPLTTPAGLPVATSGSFAGMTLQPVPEPSTFALAGLGAAALLIFRRRK